MADVAKRILMHSLAYSIDGLTDTMIARTRLRHSVRKASRTPIRRHGFFGVFAMTKRRMTTISGLW
jgi:hypothetical protein